MRARFVVSVLVSFLPLLPSGAAAALSCSAAEPVEFDGTGFIANGALERLEVRSGRPSFADWKWGLGANTQSSGSFVLSYLPNWVSNKVLGWTLNLDGAGNGTLSVTDGAELVFTRSFLVTATLRVRTGNAIRLYAKSTADAGSAIVAASVNSANGWPVSITLTTAGNSQFSEVNRYLFFPAFAAATTLTGTIRLTFPGPVPPHGSRLNFIVWAGNAACEAAGTPPSIVNPAPAPGASLGADTIVPVSVALQPGSAPIDPESARLVIDGNEVSASATRSVAGISFTPPAALFEGLHRVSASVRDAEGRAATLSWSFLTRTAPDVADVIPHGTTTTNTRPRILARFSDVGSGVDPVTVRLTLNGSDVTALATVSATDVSYVPADPLASGSQVVTVSVSDRAGNVTSRSWTFRVAVPVPTQQPAGERSPIEAPTIQLP